MSGHNLNELFHNTNLELEKTSTWFKVNKLTLDVDKTKFMLFSERDKYLVSLCNKLQIGNQIIEQIGNKCKEKYFVGRSYTTHLQKPFKCKFCN